MIYHVSPNGSAGASGAVKPGPFAILTAGETTIPVWKGSSH